MKDKIIHNKIRDGKEYDGDKYESKPRISSRLVVSVLQANHMRNQLYGQVRLPVVFDFGTHQIVYTVCLLNAAFIFPDDQWGSLPRFVTPHRFGKEEKFSMLNLRGMTFYSLSAFNDVDMSEKMQGVGFFAPMAFLYEVIGNRDQAIHILSRWEPGQSSKHAFLQHVTDIFLHVKSQLRDSSQFQKRTKRIYRDTVACIDLASSVPNFSAVSFISAYSIEDDVY